MYFKIGTDKTIALDTETTGFAWWKDKIFMVSYYSSVGKGVYRISDELISELKQICANNGILKIFHNAKFDLHFLRQLGIFACANIQDTAILAHLINDTQKVGLKGLAKRFFDPEADKWEKALKQYKRAKNLPSYDKIPDYILLPYAQADAEYTYKLWNMYLPKLKSFERLYDKEMRLTKALMQIEINGMGIDINKWKELQAVYICSRAEKEELLKKELGDINFNSSEQLAEALQNNYGIKLIEKGKDGIPLTNKEILKQIEHPIIALLFEFRNLDKLCSIYFSKDFYELVDNGRLHPTFNQVTARTGRLSCSEPNLQNIPQNSKLRQIFKAEKEFIGLDFNQLEYRIFGYFTKSPQLKQLFLENKDFHDETAKLLGVDRSVAKSINFGLMYGMGTAGYQRRYGGTKAEVEKLFNLYYKRLPALPLLRRTIGDSIDSMGFIKNSYGRMLHLSPEDKYKGLNSLIQSTAGDFAKFCMISPLITKYINEGKVVNHIHDCLLFDCNLTDEEIEEIQKDMVSRFPYPIAVTVKKYGQSWTDK